MSIPPTQRQKVLICAAHPDDEILGCGGTAAYHAHNHDEVHVLILATGAEARSGPGQAGAEIEHLQRQARAANEILGVKAVHFAELPDNRMDTLALLDVVKVIEKYIESLKPSTLYTHHRWDVNIDHQIVHQAAITACRGLPQHPVKNIYCFETASSTEWQTPLAGMAFTPQCFVDIEPYLEKKWQALQCYESEMRPFPHPRSFDGVKALATWRGTSVGTAAAEAFMVHRMLISAHGE